MKKLPNRAAVLAASHLIPLNRQTKEAPAVEELLQKHAESMAKAIEGIDGKYEIIKAEVLELAQKTDRGGGSDFMPETWGGQFTRAKSLELEGMNRGERVSLQLKATLNSATSATAGAVGSLVVPDRDSPIGLPKRRLTIRDLLNVKPAKSGSIERPKQTHRPGAAGSVAEGAKKPESDMRFTNETVSMKVIAHWLKASRQVLEDAPQLSSIIDVELRYGLALEEERQLLHGTGTGQELSGMMTRATAFDDALMTGITLPNAVDKIGMAILQASLTDLEPNGIVMHPSDWWRIRLLKDADGQYILGNPNAPLAPSLFGLPVVPTQSQNANGFLVGAFNAQTLYDRWEARVEAGFENDDFTRNLVTILGEERVGFEPEQPQALIRGIFSVG